MVARREAGVDQSGLLKGAIGSGDSINGFARARLA